MNTNYPVIKYVLTVGESALCKLVVTGAYREYWVRE